MNREEVIDLIDSVTKQKREAIEAIQRVEREKRELSNKHAWDAFRLQNKHVEEIGHSAYSHFFGGVFGGPGPVGPVGNPELLEEAAKLYIEEKAKEPIPPCISYDYTTRKFKSTSDVGIDCSSNSFFLKWFERRYEFPSWSDEDEYNAALLVGVEGRSGYEIK